MKIKKIDHVGIVVHDLSAVKDFFLDLGLELQGEGDVEGKWADRVIGLHNVKGTCAVLQPKDGQTTIELFKFYNPVDTQDIQQSYLNTLGIRHIAFAVEDIEAIVAKLKEKGIETFNEIQNYEAKYKLCCIRGPEGIILELAEEIK